MRKPRAIVLDSWAVLAYFQGEPSAASMEGIITAALKRDIPLLMSVISAGEVWYVLARELSPEKAEEGLADLRSWGVELVDIDLKLALAGAGLKAKYKMSSADAIAAALTQSRKADLVTGDNDFRQVEAMIKIEWLK